MWKQLLFAALYTLVCYLTQGQQCGNKPPQAPWDPNVTQININGGRISEKGSWPWQASLSFKRNESIDVYGHTCGAIVFDDWWILTAAHCVEGNMIGVNDSRREDPANFELILGAWNRSDPDEVGTVTHKIDMIIRHDRWLPDPTKGFSNDIALLRLIEPVDFTNPNVEAACIATEHDFNFTGSCWISGWGLLDWQDDDLPGELNEAYIDVMTNEQCQEAHFGVIRDTHICAGDETGYPNACNGDSGGPMNCEQDGVWYAAGITSWGIIFCEGVPGVYTRISKFWEWIVVNMALNPPPGY